jgi:hypothetical protein
MIFRIALGLCSPKNMSSSPPCWSLIPAKEKNDVRLQNCASHPGLLRVVGTLPVRVGR